MIQLGEWLEAFIAPNISYWQLKKLAHEAINILNIDLQLDDSDLTLQISKEIESLPEEQREKYIDPEQHHEVFLRPKSHEEEMPASEADKDEPSLHPLQGSSSIEIDSVTYHIIHTIDFAFNLIHDKEWEASLKPVADPVENFLEKYDHCVNLALTTYTEVSGEPHNDLIIPTLYEEAEYGVKTTHIWAQGFEDYFDQSQELKELIGEYEKLSKPYDIVKLKKWPSKIESKIFRPYQLRPVIKHLLSGIANYSKDWDYCIKYIKENESELYIKTLIVRYNLPLIRNLDTLYSELVERPAFKEGTIKIIRHFSQSHNDCFLYGLPTVFPWAVVVSRIFYDFFLLGGEDYMNTCQQCGRFNITHRKGRKKFCSDTCRLDHFKGKKQQPTD